MAVRRDHVKAFLVPVRAKVEEWIEKLGETVTELEDKELDCEWQEELLGNLEELQMGLETVIEQCDIEGS